jgi:hypothetical protein
MSASTSGNGNGGAWRGWLLGIGATVMATLIINGIAFQRDVRKDISELEVKVMYLEQRSERTIKYLTERMDERAEHLEANIERLEKRIDELEKRPK